MKSYITSQLNTNEELLYVCRRHWMSLLPALLSVVCALALLLNSSKFTGLVDQYPAAVSAVKVTVYLIAFVLFYRAAKDALIFLTTELGFTDRRLIGKVGSVRMRSLLTPLDKINHISATNGVFGRFLGFGNVLVHTSSGQITYEQIVNHSGFINALMDQIAVWHHEAGLGQASGRGHGDGPEANSPRQLPTPSPRDARVQAYAQAPVPAPVPPVAAPEPPPSSRPARAEAAGDLRAPGAGPPDRDQNAPVVSQAAAAALLPAPPAAPAAPQNPLAPEADPAATSLIGRCQNCQAPYSYTPAQAGRTSKCRNCGAPVIVPSKFAAG
jgi:membrane protein YdbS with pleckstrin-like domain